MGQLTKMWSHRRATLRFVDRHAWTQTPTALCRQQFVTAGVPVRAAHNFRSPSA